MNSVQKMLAGGVLLLLSSVPTVVRATVVGGGYSRQFLGNTGLEQYEMFVREPLPYKNILGDTLLVASAVEFAMAVLRDADVGNSEVARFSFMPQLVLKPNGRTQYFAGLGAGFMAGDTQFERHDLGGGFFLASKVGVRLFLGESWGLESGYYHQSNGGIYDHNASLNMLHLAFFLTY